jgi:hypothetical protein
MRPGSQTHAAEVVAYQAYCATQSMCTVSLAYVVFAQSYVHHIQRSQVIPAHAPGTASALRHRSSRSSSLKQQHALQRTQSGYVVPKCSSSDARAHEHNLVLVLQQITPITLCQVAHAQPVFTAPSRRRQYGQPLHNPISYMRSAPERWPLQALLLQLALPLPASAGRARRQHFIYKPTCVLQHSTRSAQTTWSKPARRTK